MGKSKTSSSGVDNVTAGRQHDAWVNSQAYAKSAIPGMDAATHQAQANDQSTAQAGQIGVGALSGNADDIAKLYNPYQQNVIDAANAQWGRQASNVQNSIAGQFSKSGAFGGTRQGVATGVGLGEVANNQMQQIAGLQYNGYNNAMNQANGLAQLGQGANAQSAGLSQQQQEFAAQEAARRQQGLLNAAGTLNHGTTQTTPGNLIGDVAGIASIAGSFMGGGAGGSAGAASALGNNAIASSPYLMNLNVGAPQIPGSLGYGSGMGG